MAYTKVFAIRKRLNKSIQYVQNSEKTELAAMIQYAENEEKEALVSALNCQIETAYNEMQLTKERWQKVELFLNQKKTLDTFREKKAITQAQYEKSLGDLRDKMQMQGVQ